MAQVVFKFLGDTRSTRRAFGTVGRGLRGIGDDAQKASARLDFAGRQLTRTLAPVAAAIGGLAVREFARFDDALTGSISIMGTAGDALRTQLGDGAKEVARTTRTSAADAAGAYEFLALAGFTAEQSLAALPIVAKTAQAAGAELQLTTDLLTDSLAGLGLAVDDARQRQANLARVSDVLALVSTKANANIVQLGEALTTKSGAALRAFGKDVEEGAAVLGVFADQGIKGTIAGERLSTFLAGLSRAATENADAFADLGIEVFDSEGNFRNIADVVDSLTGALGSMSDKERTAALAAAGVTKQTAAATVELLGMGDRIRFLEAAARSAGGTVDTLADRQMRSLAAQFDVAKNKAQLAAIEFGGALAPAAGVASDAVGGLASGLEAIGPAGTTALVGLTGLAFAAGPTVRLLGGVVGRLDKLAKAGQAVRVMEGLGGAMGIAGRTTKAAGTASAALLANLGPLAVAGGAVAAALVVGNVAARRARDGFDTAAEAAEKLATTAENASKALVASAEGDFNEASRLTQEFVTANANAIAQLKDTADEAARERFLLSIGYELVQDGSSLDDALAAIELLAAEAGVTIPVGFTLDPDDASAQVARISADIRDAAASLDFDAPGSTRLFETLRSAAAAAAEAFDAGDIQGAIAAISSYEQALASSGATADQVRYATDELTDRFLQLIEGVAGFSTRDARDLRGALEQIAGGATTASFETQKLAEATLALAGDGEITNDVLDRAARTASRLATERRDQAQAELEAAGAHREGASATGEQTTATLEDTEATLENAAAHGEAEQKVRGETAARREAVDPAFALIAAEDRLADARKEKSEAKDEEARKDAREKERRAIFDILGAQEEIANAQAAGFDVAGEFEAILGEAADRGIDIGDAFDEVTDKIREAVRLVDRLTQSGTIRIDIPEGAGTVAPPPPPPAPRTPPPDEVARRGDPDEGLPGGVRRSSLVQNFNFSGPVTDRITGDAAAFGVKIASGGG